MTRVLYLQSGARVRTAGKLWLLINRSRFLEWSHRELCLSDSPISPPAVRMKLLSLVQLNRLIH